MVSGLLSAEGTGQESVGWYTKPSSFCGSQVQTARSAAWGLLIIDSDQCLGHSDGTVVKADKSHFTLLINLLLLKLSRFPVVFKMSTRWRQMFCLFLFVFVFSCSELLP